MKMLRRYLTRIILLMTLAFVTNACAQPELNALELVKTIAVRSSDDPAYAHMRWSPESLAWSPDGKRIAYTSTGMRRFGVIDIETGKNTEIISEFRGGSDVLWSKNLNRLVVLHDTSFIVFDMSKEPAQRLYTVENKFPKLLSARIGGAASGGAGIVSLRGEDHLVLVGKTNWREEPANPHVAVYSLQTGQRIERFNYQFKNEPYDKLFPVRKDGSPSFLPWKAKIGISSQGDILVSVYAKRDTAQPENLSNGIPMEDVVWVVNLETKKIVCEFEVEQKKPIGHIFLFSRDIKIASSSENNLVVLTNLSGQSLYDTDTCNKLHDMPENVEDKKNKIFPATNIILSNNKKWIFGFDYNELNPSKAAFKLWRLSDGKLLHDGYWPFVFGVATAEFSNDSRYLAWSTANVIKIYLIKSAS